MSKHHAIYMRVSTRRQDTASQEPELKSWAQSHEGDFWWYHDSYTGTSMDRPGFRQLIKDMETGQVDTLRCSLAPLDASKCLRLTREPFSQRDGVDQRAGVRGDPLPRSRRGATVFLREIGMPRGQPLPFRRTGLHQRPDFGVLPSRGYYPGKKVSHPCTY